MATFDRSLRVRAPFEDVWAFHNRIDGLLALTPDWLHPRVDRVEGDDDGDLVPGTTICLSARPFGVAPRQRMAARIEEREREGDESGFFRDSMVDGPLREWAHTHSFRADGEHTYVHDHVEYDTGAGAPGNLAVQSGLAAFFAYRHRRTRDELES